MTGLATATLALRLRARRIMTRDISPTTSTAPAAMLHWVPRRDTSAITCQLDVRGDHRYELCVVPHWDPAAAVIERFSAPTAALLRHAEVASLFREQGWMVIEHVAGRGAAAA